MRNNVILAIAPGKRELGVAVFSGFNLLYVSVKSIRLQKTNEDSIKKMSGILQKLFHEFSIDVVVIKAISQYQRLSPDLQSVTEYIKFESAQNGLQRAEITIEQIKSVLCKNRKATQESAFESLLMPYPELKNYWNRPNKWQKDYYAFLFSAVAAGVVYLKTISEND